MMWETSRMDLWTGSARVRVYSQMPNAAPTAQTNSPKNKIAWLVTAPWTKLTWSSSGKWMSASPAKAPVAASSKRPMKTFRFGIRRKA